MTNTLIADTGFWYALINKTDKYHPVAMTFMSTCRKKLITTWPVITETCYLLQSRHGIKATQQFLKMGSLALFETFSLSHSQMPEIALLMEKYADLPMDLADASLVILAANLGHGQILSTDQRDFRAYRWKNREPFQNLLLPD